MNFHKAPLTYTGEVHLNVLDLINLSIFIKKLLDLRYLKKTADKAVLTADGKTPLLIIEQPENVTPKEPINLDFIISHFYCRKELT